MENNKKEFRLTGHPVCPDCNKKQDGAVGFDAQMPREGDYCICAYCATISRYAVDNGEYKLRKATEEDFDVAAECGILAELVRAQALVTLMIHELKTRNS